MIAELPPLRVVDLIAAIPLVLTAAGARWGLVTMAQRGIGLRVLSTLHRALVSFMATLLLSASVLFATGRAGSVWYGLTAAGIFGMALLWNRGPSLWRARREAEERRMLAHDF